MADIQIRITNLPQIKAAFKRSPILMAREMSKAIQKSAFAITADSKRNTPVATGRLRASTYTRFGSAFGFSMQGEVGTNTDYDVFVHEGTRFMKARPYLRQAVESNSDKVNRFFTEGLDKVLSDIGKAT